MNAAQLRALGFIEAADAADERAWQGERARVYVAHISKSPLDADLCAERAALAELTDDEIALMEAMTRETASAAPTYDGMWK